MPFDDVAVAREALAARAVLRVRIPFDAAVEDDRRDDFAARSALRHAATSRTDTRTLAPGDTFLALRGERYDGHDLRTAMPSARGGA